MQRTLRTKSNSHLTGTNMEKNVSVGRLEICRNKKTKSYFKEKFFSSSQYFSIGGPPAAFVKAEFGFFSLMNSWKWKKIVREFVKTISFVIREKTKYCSRIRENWKTCSWIREFLCIRDFWFVNRHNPAFPPSFVNSWKSKIWFVNSWIEPPWGAS